MNFDKLLWKKNLQFFTSPCTRWLIKYKIFRYFSLNPSSQYSFSQLFMYCLMSPWSTSPYSRFSFNWFVDFDRLIVLRGKWIDPKYVSYSCDEMPNNVYYSVFALFNARDLKNVVEWLRNISCSTYKII